MGIMDTLFFTYNTLVIGVALIACSVSLVVWFMTHRRDCVLAATGFGLYALEVALVFFDEYANAKVPFDQLFEMPLAHPWLSWGINVAVTVCLWAWTLTRVHAGFSRKRICAIAAVYALVSAVLLPAFGMPSALRQWIYWMWRDLALMGCFVFGFWWYRTRATKAQQLDLHHSKRFFIIAFCLSICVVLEDTFMLLMLRPSGNPEELMFLWYLSKRNVSENILMMVGAYYLLRLWRELLSVYARHPRNEAVVEGPAAVSEQALADRLALFGEDKGLSKRELEVLEQVLRGADMQHIADALFISSGTVKAHLHRIYKKSGVAKREDLIEVFWRS